MPNKTNTSATQRPIKNNPADLKTFESKAEAVAQDYAIKFKGDVLRWRAEEGQLIILFMDGRKFYFPIPTGWGKP